MPYPVSCEWCGAPFNQRNIRTLVWGNSRMFVCKTCLLKLPEEHRSHAQRQSKLAEKVLYRQTEFPF